MVDTVRVPSYFLDYLHPNIKNAMPDATVFESQLARDLIVSLATGFSFVVIIDGTTYPTTYAGLQTAENALPAGGGTIIIPQNTTITGAPSSYLPTKSNVDIVGINNKTSTFQAQAGAVNNVLLNYLGTTTGVVSNLTSDTTIGSPDVAVTSLAAIHPGAVNGDGAIFAVGYASGYLQVCRASSYSGNTITMEDCMQAAFTVGSGARASRITGAINYRRTKNLHFSGTGNSGTTYAVSLGYCTFCVIEDCIFENFPNSAIIGDYGYGNKFIGNLSIQNGSGSDGGMLLLRQGRWTIDRHETERDQFSVNLVYCYAGAAGVIRISRSVTRSLKLLNSSGNTFASVHWQAEVAGGGGLLINGESANNSFGACVLSGGDIGIDVAGTGPTDHGSGNIFSAVSTTGQATWAAFLDANSVKNIIGILTRTAAVGDAGTANQVVTNIAL